MQNPWKTRAGSTILAGLLFVCMLTGLSAGVRAEDAAETRNVKADAQNDAIPGRSITGSCAEGRGHDNPATFYCTALGYTVEIVEGSDGGKHAQCVLPDTTRCDAWQFFQGSCGQGFSYCARFGMQVRTKSDGNDPFSPRYAACFGGSEEIGSVTELMGLRERYQRSIHFFEGPVIKRAQRLPGGEARTAPGVPAALPAGFDWRNYNGQNWMTRVGDQAQCGACWAFSAIGAVEAVYNIAANNPDLDLDLSEEYLNSDASSAGSCCGGWHSSALLFMKTHGVPDEACMPWDVSYYSTGSCSCYPNPPCNSACGGLPLSCSNLNAVDACGDVAGRLVPIADYGPVAADADQIRQALIDKGPLSVCLAMSGVTDAQGVYRCSTSTCWDRNGNSACDMAGQCIGGRCGGTGWSCGVNADCDEDRNSDGACSQDDCGINHCVVLLGYDDAGGYWIAKNSWGDTWGPHASGYWEVGYGECHIEQEVYYAKAADINLPPIAEAGGPYSGECQGQSTTVSLDGSGSGDPNPGDTLTYAWSTTCPNGSFDNPSGIKPKLTVGSAPGCSVACEVSLTVTDSFGQSNTDTASVTVKDTLDPVIVCPADRTIECTESSDPTNTGTATASDLCSPAPVITFADASTPGACAGASVIARTWTATDACGNASSCLQTIHVVDTTPPVIQGIAATPGSLWPPNHKMVPVTVAVTATDGCDTAPVCKISEVTSNEPVNGLGDGNTGPDWVIAGDASVKLRAERSGKGKGRIYTITVTCTDACGNERDGTVNVTVPKSRGK